MVFRRETVKTHLGILIAVIRIMVYIVWINSPNSLPKTFADEDLGNIPNSYTNSLGIIRKTFAQTNFLKIDTKLTQI